MRIVGVLALVGLASCSTPCANGDRPLSGRISQGSVLVVRTRKTDVIALALYGGALESRGVDAAISSAFGWDFIVGRSSEQRAREAIADVEARSSCIPRPLDGRWTSPPPFGVDSRALQEGTAAPVIRAMLARLRDAKGEGELTPLDVTRVGYVECTIGGGAPAAEVWIWSSNDAVPLSVFQILPDSAGGEQRYACNVYARYLER
ncbi:MAG: hypothetical protein P1V36_15445 [Planctomycetota bacterium]|nr:hypothetical protein [Planctomycetota bacterium]